MGGSRMQLVLILLSLPLLLLDLAIPHLGGERDFQDYKIRHVGEVITDCVSVDILEGCLLCRFQNMWPVPMMLL